VIKTTNKQDISGILFLHKPVGVSSNKALQIVKRHFNAQKAGHVGTLDPLASGILPICFGEATKFAHILQGSNKTYQVTGTLGITTTTGDAEGEIIANTPVPQISQQYFKQVLLAFKGTQQQLPPMFSALKVNGQPLYKLARQGITIERKLRTIVIEEIELISLTATKFVIMVTCSKGSYMRTLSEDIGSALKCGAHMSALVRTKVANINLATCTGLDDVVQQAPNVGLLTSINSLTSLLTTVTLTATQEQDLRHGKSVQLPDCNLPAQDDIGLLAQATNNLIGLGKIANNLLISQRLLRTSDEN
jgi:tRNA pseudouridine55 synthase